MPLLKFGKQVIGEFGKDKIGQQSAAFAYVAIFSIGPLLLVVISVVSFIYGQKAAQGQLFNHLSSVVGNSTAKSLQTVVANSHKSSNNLLALVIGAVGLLLGAGGLTSQLQTSFNSIFGVVPDPASGIKRTVYVKLKNVVLVLIGAVAVLVSLFVSALVSQIAKSAVDYTGVPPLVLELINSVASLLAFAGILYLLYKTLPDVKLPRQVVAMAALLTSLLFVVGKLILGFIIGRNGTASAYGAAASLVTLLLWIYYSGQIVFLGAEGIKVYATNNSLILSPKKQTLNRQTFVYDSKNFKGKLLESFVRGLKSDKSGKK